MYGDEIGRKRIERVRRPKGIIVAPSCKQKSSADRRRTQGFPRHSPIDALQQITQLRQRDRHCSVGGRRPQEPSPFEPFGEEAQALTIAPNTFDQIRPCDRGSQTNGFNADRAQRLLDEQRKPIEALARAGAAGR